MSEDKGSYGFVAGLFLGAALGAVTALLFAPMTGREVRETLAEEKKKFRERTDRAVADLRARGEEILERTRKAGCQTVQGENEFEETVEEG